MLDINKFFSGGFSKGALTELVGCYVPPDARWKGAGYTMAAMQEALRQGHKIVHINLERGLPDGYSGVGLLPEAR